MAPFLAGAIILVFAAVVRDWRLPLRVLWWPGLLLFLAVTVPWYVAVQVRNPEFFRVFILEHNLARFSTDLYRHTQPFWYFIPVALLGLIPWTVLILAAVYENTRVVWAERKYGIKAEDEYNIFLLIWLFLPIVFFSISNSKLPGYILPALPAGALLLAEYVRRRLTTDQPMPAGLAGIHALVAAGILVPALLVGYIWTRSLAIASQWPGARRGVAVVRGRNHLRPCATSWHALLALCNANTGCTGRVGIASDRRPGGECQSVAASGGQRFIATGGSVAPGRSAWSFPRQGIRARLLSQYAGLEVRAR